MTWGKVDDKLHSSPKWRASPKTARALWTTAMSWCCDQLTDGHVPASMLGYLDGTKSEAAALVRAGLWDLADGGWDFHDWADYQPDAASTKARREKKSKAGGEGNHTRWHVARGIDVEGCEWCDSIANRSQVRITCESGANPPVPVPVPDPCDSPSVGGSSRETKSKSSSSVTSETGHVLDLDSRRRGANT